MSRIEEKDILMFLDKTSGEDHKKAVKSWAKADDSNKRDLRVYKKIYKEVANLESFNLVNESDEWNAFLKKTSPEIGDLQILNHLDGYSNYSERKAIENWTSQSEENKRDLKIYDLIISESPNLANIKFVDPKLEWNSFKTQQEENTAKITPLITANENKSSIFPMWQRMAVAAAIAILLAAIYTFRPQETYSEYATTNEPYTIEMVDGSQIELAENSTLRYPKTLKNMAERRLYLQGQGKFDVAENKEKPFIVEVNEVIGIEVLGTIFKVNDHSEFVEVIENIEGKVRAYVLNKPDVEIILEEGDKFGYDGEKFIDLNAEPELVDNSKEYEILHVLDFLMETSNWKVVSSPYTEFEEKGIVKVDLEKPYEEILEDLLIQADFEYAPMACEGCFIINKFRPLEY